MVGPIQLGSEQQSINKFSHYTAEIEGLTIHFIHQKSAAPDAIPLLLLHGWPGSFLEFLPLIDDLTKQATTKSGKPVSFDVIVPSLPGFALSSAPPIHWTKEDTARVFNTLVTRALGDGEYATFGADWGAGVAYALYDGFNTTVRAAHFAFIPFFPLDRAQPAEQNITLSPLDTFEEGNMLGSWNMEYEIRNMKGVNVNVNETR